MHNIKDFGTEKVKRLHLHELTSIAYENLLAAWMHNAYITTLLCVFAMSACTCTNQVMQGCDKLTCFVLK